METNKTNIWLRTSSAFSLIWARLCCPNALWTCALYKVFRPVNPSYDLNVSTRRGSSKTWIVFFLTSKNTCWKLCQRCPRDLSFKKLLFLIPSHRRPIHLIENLTNDDIGTHIQLSHCEYYFIILLHCDTPGFYYYYYLFFCFGYYFRFLIIVDHWDGRYFQRLFAPLDIGSFNLNIDVQLVKCTLKSINYCIKCTNNNCFLLWIPKGKGLVRWLV